MDVAAKRLRHASEQERTKKGKTQELPQMFSFRLLQPDYAFIPFHLREGSQVGTRDDKSQQTISGTRPGTRWILVAACPHCVSGAALALAPAFYFQGIEELEGERGFRGEGDIALACEASAASARGAFTLPGAVLGGRGGLDIVVLILDGDAGEDEREDSAAFESSSGLGVLYETRSASSLGDGELAVDLDRDLDSGGKCLPGSADLGADGLVEENRNDRLGWDN
jgi:hypothetical protein